MGNSLPRYGSPLLKSDPRRHIQNYGASLGHRARELMTLLPDAVLIGCTSAHLHGLDVLPPGVGDHSWPVEAALDPTQVRRPSPGVLLRAQRLSASEVVRTAGLRTASLERTLIDAAACLPRPQALAAADQLVRAGADPALAARLCRSFRDGVPQLRSIIDLADGRAESPGESAMRCLAVDAGFPPPQVQIPLLGGAIRLDMGYEEFRLAMEYDGYEFHRSSAEQVQADEHRRERIAALNWRTLVATKESVLIDPEDFLGPLLRALTDAGWSPPQGWLTVVRRRINSIAMQYRKARENGTLYLL